MTESGQHVKAQETAFPPKKKPCPAKGTPQAPKAASPIAPIAAGPSANVQANEAGPTTGAGPGKLTRVNIILEPAIHRRLTWWAADNDMTLAAAAAAAVKLMVATYRPRDLD